MKARCIKELTIDGYRFEPGKEYDIEWHAFHRPLFTPDILGMATHQPDWPRRTEVVVYARKEDREKVLMKMSQKDYVVTKFVEVSGLQAELMGEGCFIAVMADLLRPNPVRWEPSPYSVVKAWQDRMQNNVIYPSSELLDQMKDFFPMRRHRMPGGTRPSDWPSLRKEQENE